MKLKENAKKIKRRIPALYLALRHEKTPLAAKIMAALTVAYALSPIDLIPDFIPVLGYLDDLILLPIMAALTVKLIPTEVLEECMRESDGMWHNGKPKKWYYAVPIVLLWLFILALLIKAFITIII